MEFGPSFHFNGTQNDDEGQSQNYGRWKNLVINYFKQSKLNESRTRILNIDWRSR